jgi:AcrR family transcriptional regulator
MKSGANTRERILLEALNLFSMKGFEPVTVRDIARAVGIKESSIYNHFINKQDIFDSIIQTYSERGNELFHSMELIGDDMEFLVDTRTVSMYQQMTPDQFAAIAGQIFEFYFVDEINAKLRKMLAIEQFRNPEISTLFRKLSFDDAIDFQSNLFAALIAAGCFIQTDPYLMALAFFAPIFLIFNKYDNNEQSLREAKQLFIRHIDHFNKVYGVTNGMPARA